MRQSASWREIALSSIDHPPKAAQNENLKGTKLETLLQISPKQSAQLCERRFAKAKRFQDYRSQQLRNLKPRKNLCDADMFARLQEAVRRKNFAKRHMPFVRPIEIPASSEQGSRLPLNLPPVFDNKPILP